MSRHVFFRIAMFVAATALIGGTAVADAAVPSHGKIGPRQYFVGLVNGSSGLAHHAQIRVACPGPIRSGETTHPLQGQTLKVTRAPAIIAKDGFTGPRGTHINAYLGIPPAAADGGGIASFAYYDTPKPIPTTLTVPCSGSGFVTFIPFPRDPGKSRSFVVPVDYVNIAV
jgi:hypothetical protein